MRILAIRGENLASLRRFEVDLTAEPLAGAGLFAITGPTGAGKSTLLDALCLALYDTTPRLEGRGGAKIGPGDVDEADKLAASDVRNVLRRGAGEGYAEVDFVGRDRGRYRARWTVRRARKKPDGRFQPQKAELWRIDADGEITATMTTDRKTDTLALVSRAVGLDFDQFRRSVLLAQGEFDRFLKADKGQRGELLEAMTGADLYRRLGEGAHRREREQRTELDHLQARVDGIEVLDDPLRRRVERRVEAAQHWVEAAERRRAALEEAARWYAERARLVEAEGQAIHALDEAETALDEHTEWRERLDDVEAAEPHRDTLRDYDAAAAAARTAQDDAVARARALEQLDARLVAARADEQTAEDARRAAHQAADARAPALAAARSLDTEIAHAERVARGAATDVERCGERCAAIEREREARQTARAADQRALDAADAWLAAHPSVAAIDARRAHWLDRLAALAEARRAVDDARARCAAAEADHVEAARAVEAADATRGEADAALAAGREAVDPGAAQTAAAAVREATERFEHLGDKERRLKNLLDRAREADRLDRQRAAAVDARAAARKQARAEKSRARRLDKKIAEHAAELDAAERRLALLRAGLSLAEHRAELVDGEPCPLCGATEHPGVELAESEAVVDAEAAAVHALRDALDGERVDHGRAEERAAAAEVDAAEADAAITDAEAALDAVASDWALARMGYGAELPADPQGAEPVVSAAIEANHVAREAADAAVAAARAAVDDLEARRAALAGLSHAVDAATRELHAARDGERAAAAALAAATSAVETRRARAADVARDLDAVFAGWPGWPGVDAASGAGEGAFDVAAFTATVTRQLDGYGEQTDRRRAASEAVAAADRALTELAAVARQRSEALAEARTAAEAARAAHAERIAARAEVFDGRTVEAVEAEIQRTLRAADADAEQARTERTTVEAHHEAAADRRAEAEKARDRAARAVELHRELLDEALAELEIDEDTLRGHLSHGREWAGRARQKIVEIERALDAAQVLHRERKRAREEHERRGRPALEARALPDARAAVDTALQAFREAYEDDRALLRQDTHARERRAELAPDLGEATRALRVLGELSMLIGSHDGAKFRDFAQSLTLDAVVGLANQHLRELAPRYALMRVPDEDLELQVIDCDMGDEIRSVQSLSGGESFLVSLALALGLASLSARDTRLESLFIDEGFGTLDVKTLDQALDTLDALQASGRQVGLISHVPHFAERVGIQVAVVPEAPGQSRVEVHGVAG